MRIRDFSGIDFEFLARLLGDQWHSKHGARAYWHGADELCCHLSRTHKGFVAVSSEGDGTFADKGEVPLGAILMRGSTEEDGNHDLAMHWLQQRTRIGAMAAALGINSRADVEFLTQENEFFDTYCEATNEQAIGAVELLMVKPEARGQGVGKALLRQGLAWLEEHGAREVCLVTDTECDWQAYEHLGMERAANKDDEIFVYKSPVDNLCARLG